ncbi:hypothetical protein [Hallerella succinigenes]|uniref:hypothetical protein n=1 Tax=Hallerella succinigenes TaxID=1896222 RepID=UPI0023F0B49B|nr:hypothetical protein [Hallerella succinigenes]
MSWSIPKPMESITNYNVMLIHGAYGKEKGFLDISDTTKIKEAYAATKALDNGAALGRYHENFDDEPRLLHWLTPGTLKKVSIKTVMPQGGESTVVLEVLRAKQRHVLPAKMFDME